MPRTFKALAKCYIDDSIIPEGKLFTTDFFDGKGKKVPDHLKEEKPGAAVANTGDDDTDTDSEENLESMTVPQLKDIAEALGIEGFKSLTKPNLIVGIESIRMLNDSSTTAGTGLVQPIKSVNDATPV